MPFKSNKLNKPSTTKRNGLFSSSTRSTRSSGLLGKSHKTTRLGPSTRARTIKSPKTQAVRPSMVGGKMTSAKGSMKQSMGRMFNSPGLVASGIQDQLKGEAKKASARYKRSL